MQILDQVILNCALALDHKDYPEALAVLRGGPVSDGAPAQRLHILSLWRRTLVYQAATLVGQVRATKVKLILDMVEQSVRSGDLRPFLDRIEHVATVLDPADIGAMLVGCLHDALAQAPSDRQFEALDWIALGDTPVREVSAWQLVLRTSPEAVPTFWQFQMLAKAATRSERDTRDVVEEAGRDDLRPLFAVFQGFLAAAPADEVLAQAMALPDARHRQRVAEYLMTAPTTSERMKLAAKALDALNTSPPDDKSLLFALRLAACEKRWQAILDATKDSGAAEVFSPCVRTSYDIICMRALALAQLGDANAAAEALDFIQIGGRAPWYVRGRAALVQMDATLRDAGQTVPEARPIPRWSVRAGRPLVQALWVGPRLRWIEELSIASYLRNGWRYQLYVYDIPENVPQGVEVLDAAAILPRARVFAEGAGSKGHVGSLGAFSDLFRYALLAARGGMWSDTDVINLHRFEPEGQRFVSTERTDVSFVGPNGAMMAAAAGDPFVCTALDRAEQIIARDQVRFSAIGPDLLAELIGQDGFEGVDLMPPDFLNPITWMETGMLLGSSAALATKLRKIGAPNLHVYTETWRQFGLGMQAPPDSTTFLGRLYADLVAGQSTGQITGAGKRQGTGDANVADLLAQMEGA